MKTEPPGRRRSRVRGGAVSLWLSGRKEFCEAKRMEVALGGGGCSRLLGSLCCFSACGPRAAVAEAPFALGCDRLPFRGRGDRHDGRDRSVMCL
jgi:hypothetical protein